MNHPFIPQPQGSPAATILTAGVQSLQAALDYKNERDRQKAHDEAQLLQNGLMTDQDSQSPTYGHVIRTPDSEAAYQQDLNEKDASTPESDTKRKMAVGILSAAGRNDLAGLISPSMSGYQAGQFLQMAKSDIQGAWNVAAKKPMIDLSAQRLDLQKSKFGNEQNMQGQNIANKDPDIISNQQRLNGVLRINDIIKKVDSGELKDTTQIKNSIGNEYAKLETGINNLGLGQEQRNTILSNFNEDKNHILNYFDQSVSGGALPQDAMHQLKTEIGTMADSYMNQFDQRHQFLRSNLPPAQQDVLDSKLNGMRSTYTKRFGYWNGPGAEGDEAQGMLPGSPSSSGMLKSPSPQLQQQGQPQSGIKGPPPGGGLIQNQSSSDHDAAVQWAKSNPNDPRSAQILKMNGM